MGPAPMKIDKWTIEQQTLALELYDRGKSAQYIAEQVGRTIAATQRKLTMMNLRRRGGGGMAAPKRRDRKSERSVTFNPERRSREYRGEARGASQEAIAEHDLRSRLRHRTLTAAVLGDPLPGYSALDRKQEL